jgi:hypothetical protein
MIIRMAGVAPLALAARSRAAIFEVDPGPARVGGDG